MKKKLVCVLAAVLLLGTITAGAAYLFQWNDNLAERFGVNEEQQEMLASNGVIASVDQSVTANGLTVSALQTLGDKNGMYILLDVKAPEGMALSGDNLFEGFNVTIDGAPNINYFSSFVDGDADGNSDFSANERYYEIWIFNSEQESLSGRKIDISFTNLQGDKGKQNMCTILKGEWDLSWALNYTDCTVNYDINEHYNVGSREVLVKSVEMSPLSMSVYVSGDGVNELYDMLNVDQCNSLFNPSVTMQDGTSFDATGGPGSEGWTDSNKQVYFRTSCFNEVLDLSKATSVSLVFPTGDAVDTIIVPLTK